MPDIGFLEGEFERIIADHGSAADSENIIELNPHARGRLQERDRRFRALLESLPAAIYTTDATGGITYFNEAAAELWGQRPQPGSAEWCGSLRLYAVDGKPMRHDECPMAIALKENRAVRGMEAVAERPDGSRVPFIPYPTPLHDSSGRMVGAVNMLIDITDRKRAEEEQNMLVRELHHRVRNTLAIAQAIVSSTAKNSDTVEGFKDALIGRISALARTHLLLSDAVGAIPFETMLRNELDPFDDTSGARIVMSGPPAQISTKHAVPLGMALHELTTNSAKYGALSALDGRVEVTWRIITEAERRVLEFDWRETGGPLLTTAPLRRGFGSQLIEVVLPRQIHATTHIEYRPEGLHVSVRLPLPAVESHSS